MHDEAMARLRAANPIEGTPDVRPVDDVIAGWGAAALGRSSTEPSARRRSPWRTSGLSIVLALAVGSGSAAAAYTAFTGHPIPQSPDTVTVRPAAGTTHVSTVRAADPDGGPAWALRIGTAPGGLRCLGVGQVDDDGRFGLVGLDGVFRTVTPAGADDCGVAPRGTRSTVQVRTFLGARSSRDVTVIYGIRGPGIRSVRVQYVDGVAALLPVDRDGAFVVARRGNLTEQRPAVVMRSAAPGPHAVEVIKLGTPLPASRAGCGAPGRPSVAQCHVIRPLVPSEGVR